MATGPSYRAWVPVLATVHDYRSWISITTTGSSHRSPLLVLATGLIVFIENNTLPVITSVVTHVMNKSDLYCNVIVVLSLLYNVILVLFCYRLSCK